ncbi:hypothetical protein HMPREF1581_00956 [Gardnerella vaginalis JCP8108]|uniref:Uncharacterized protein n=3 Tax=Gardnerella vaginalis TaxID=2702 RepID=S4I071_GARVA|nr:hypothetical protein HMPREF1581_00956 [Gardnerella vaginalis JCP8108]
MRKEKSMSLDELRNDIIIKQKKGLPFILTSVVIWLLITVVAALDINIAMKNILVFCCSMPMLPLSWLIGKKIGVDIFSKDNELGNLGFLFTMNQILYLLIVIWVFNAVPDKMIMVYAMVFGAHLLPYSWLYKSKAYRVFAIIIPVLSLVLGNLFGGFVVAGTAAAVEIAFVFILRNELNGI